MTILTNTAALNMDDLSAILQPIANQANYTNVSTDGFTAHGTGLFAPAIEVEGSFLLVPNSTVIATGSITKITYVGIEGEHTIVPVTGINYLGFVGALGNNDSLLDLLFSALDTITGSGGSDILHGGGLGDMIHGGGGKDAIYGDDGNDHLYGDGGADHLFGGAGPDWLSGGNGVDRIDGGSDIDTVDYGTAKGPVVATLAGANWVDVKVDGTVVDKLKNVESIYSGNHNDTLTGDGRSNGFFGNGGKDLLKGGAGRDGLYGGAGNDILRGGAGKDLLSGGPGKDTLTGGDGADNFTFITTPDGKDIDTITDLKVGQDFITLSAMAFHIGTPVNYISVSGFFATGHAKDADDRIIYKAGSGDLLFDADGNGSGKPVVFAHLHGGLALTESDFLLAM